MLRKIQQNIRAAFCTFAICVSKLALCAAAQENPDASIISLSKQAPDSIVSVVSARFGQGVKVLRTTGVVVADPRSVHDVNAYVTGEISQVFVRTGDRVKAGSPLIAIYSPDFIAAQRNYLALIANNDQRDILRDEGRLDQYMKDARENLMWWGLSKTQLEALERQSQIVEEILLHAETDGMITQVFVEPGALINAGDKSMKAFIVTGKAVARMIDMRYAHQIEAYVFPEQLSQLRVGDAVAVTGPGEEAIETKIAQVIPDVDPLTQRGRFRINIHQDVRWLPGSALLLSIRLNRSKGIWIPREALLTQEISPYVFVQIANRRYERRKVSILAEAETDVQIEGIRPEDRVVTTGKTLLEGAYRMKRSPVQQDDHHHH